MTPLEIAVTAEDIREGKRDHCFRCPVALAIARALEVIDHDVFVGVVSATVRTSDDERAYMLPDEARMFIRAFDNRESVAPFTFRLE